MDVKRMQVRVRASLAAMVGARSRRVEAIPGETAGRLRPSEDFSD